MEKITSLELTKLTGDLTVTRHAKTIRDVKIAKNHVKDLGLSLDFESYTKVAKDGSGLLIYLLTWPEIVVVARGYSTKHLIKIATALEKQK